MAATRNHLETLLLEHRGKTVDKWEQYLSIYANELAPYIERNQPVRLLEIGVQNGGSLEIWSKYLPAGSAVVGIDIDPKVADLKFDGAVTAYVADATDRSKIEEMLGSQIFDIIIDDGSHVSADIISAFRSLFDRLAFGGKFIIEDLHASYWRSHGGGFRLGTSAVEFFKNLVDALNTDHLEQSGLPPDGVLAELQQFGRSIARIAFYDSVAVVEKLTRGKTAPYRRIIGGVDFDVVDPAIGVMTLPVAKIAPLLFSDEQKQHVEAKILARQEEMLAKLDEAGQQFRRLEAERARAVAENAQLAAVLADLKSQNQQLHGVRARDVAVLEDARNQIKEIEEHGNLQRQMYLRDRQAYQAAFAKLEARLHDVLSSTSWRLTGPLRRSVRLARRMLKPVPAAQPGPIGSAESRPSHSQPESWEKSTILKSGLFDHEWYLKHYKDVAAHNLDPLDHYLASGASEGRKPNRLFDSAWYLQQHPDVARANLNPLLHYATSGATEGRDPHPEFSSNWYLEQNPHLAKAGINPLTHYLREGQAQGLLPFSPDQRYRAQIAKERLQDAVERQELLQHVEVLIYRPRFIILIEGGDEAARAETASSCQAQIYPGWQIAHTPQDVAGLLAGGDPSSTYLIWVAAGDRLSEKAVYACAAALNADPAADLIYFDEDELHPDGRRRPFYKPDWSPDYLEAMNYIGPAACFLLSKAADLLPVADGLYDFTLRFTERAAKIVHMRQILWHRLTGPSSPISPRQAAADMRALQGRLERTGRSGAVVQNVPGYGSYDVQVSLKSEPLVSVVIPTAGKVITYEGRTIDLIVNCIDTILTRSTYKNLEFVVIDNGDFDRSRLAHIDPARLKFATFSEAEFNVAKKLNIGAAAASGPILLLLNDDVEPLMNNWIERMLEHFEKPHVGVVGAKLLYPDLTIQHVGVVLNGGNPDHVRRLAKRDDQGYFFSTCGVRNFYAVTGACMMTPANRYREIGGYTEDLGISYNDVDFCLKLAERGLTAVYAPKAELIHFESQSRETKLNLSEAAYFHQRWSTIATDAFYNEDNLTVASPTFEVHHNARII